MKVYGIEFSKKRIAGIIVKNLPSSALSFLFGSSVKQIFWVLVVLSSLLLYTIQFLGTALDKSFWLSFLNGLLPNIAIFFVAIFVIDYLIKKESKSKLKKLNQQQSKWVVFDIRRFMVRIMENFNYSDTPALKNALLSDSIHDNTLVEQGFKKFLSNGFSELETNNQYNKKLVASFEQLGKVIESGTESVTKALREIKPYPSPEALEKLSLSADIGGYLQAICSLITTLEKEKINFPQEETDKTYKMLETLHSLIHIPNLKTRLIKFSHNLTELVDLGEKNELFLDI